MLDGLPKITGTPGILGGLEASSTPEFNGAYQTTNYNLIPVYECE